MNFAIILFGLLGLQMVGSVKSESRCGEAQSALNDNSECEEEFQSFGNSESPLCSGKCLSSLVFECGEEYVS